MLMTTEPLTVDRLESWALSGAHWRVVSRSENRVTVELQQCTGERVELLESEDPELLRYLRGISSNLDLL